MTCIQICIVILQPKPHASIPNNGHDHDSKNENHDYFQIQLLPKSFQVCATPVNAHAVHSLPGCICQTCLCSGSLGCELTTCYIIASMWMVSTKILLAAHLIAVTIAILMVKVKSILMFTL